MRKRDPENLATHQQVNEDVRPLKDYKKDNIFSTVQNFDGNHNFKKVYTDQTGQFPIRSYRGYNYLMMYYAYDINAIKADPIRNRKEGEITTVYTKRMDYLKKKGFKPKIHWLDNEVVKGVQDYYLSNRIEFQFTPPIVHRCNAAEREIRTWKDHFISGLSSTHKDFPLYLWDILVPQDNITLNLLRKYRVHLTLSAHEELEGRFVYNKTPLFPPGSKVLIHEKPRTRHSWGLRSNMGWYVGPSLNHYRCVRVYLPDSKSEMITDNISIISEDDITPYLYPLDNVEQASVGREHAEHLLKSLRTCYSKVTVDWSGTLYCGLTLK